MTDAETFPDDQRAVADALRHIARNETAKQFVTKTDAVYDALRHAARRFIGGETLTECVETAQNIYRALVDAVGQATTPSMIGEETR